MLPVRILRITATPLVLLLVLATSTIASGALDQEESKQAALAAAESWLKLTDAGEYGDAWEAASGYLQGIVAKEQFTRALTGVRKPLGKLKSRQLKSASYQTSLPGAPDGEYYVIQFETSFSDKDSAVETITPKKAAAGEWQVSGYYIK